MYILVQFDRCLDIYNVYNVYKYTYVFIYLMSNSLIKFRKYFVNKFTCVMLKSLKLLLLNKFFELLLYFFKYFEKYHTMIFSYCYFLNLCIYFAIYNLEINFEINYFI